jgi:hypothetical protein
VPPPSSSSSSWRLSFGDAASHLTGTKTTVSSHFTLLLDSSISLKTIALALGETSLIAKRNNRRFQGNLSQKERHKLKDTQIQCTPDDGLMKFKKKEIHLVTFHKTKH